MPEQETWRELLKDIINDPKEKQRLAEEIGISSVTLGRWASGESDPRQQNVRKLLAALPKYRDHLLGLIKEEPGFENFSEAEIDDSSKEIPAAFYARVFSARATSVESIRFWSVCRLILQQALGQLDPNHMGVAVNVVQCMEPSGPDHKVHSLRESVGLGTHPFPADLEQKAMFLGAESLCGYVVTTARPASTQNVDDEHSLIPSHKVDVEKSAAVHPILFAGRIAGCLLASSAQYNYFQSQARVTLIDHYANLLALAFEPHEFYAADQIALGIMPNQKIQKQHFANFRHRVADTMIEGLRNGHPVHNILAEQMVWQQLEHELLEVSAAMYR